MKKFLLFTLSLLSCAVIHAQDFEGIVEFKQQEGTSVETFVWYVKGDMVRIDEFETGSRVLKSCYLINTKDSSVRYLDHKAKTSAAFRRIATAVPSAATVQETKNDKELHTYKVTESIVKVQDTSFSYWMNSGKFGFFKPAVKLLGNQNMYFRYYWALDPKDNSMPLLITRQNSKDEETGRYEVTRIEKRTIDANLFTVPSDYKQQ